ncbi:MAG: CDF family Co(II)/Ni(II) efflux transporter DmeF [Gammaproteobacteria bacterium]|nr:CDF family Co(II)/Ni(II) efflux transporter DmeF [Gammaproteobacteria bacterium]
MHNTDLSSWRHDHRFHADRLAAERGTRIVALVTAVTMVLEIATGWWFNSMALLADGWHMGSHVLAIGLSALAYATARNYASDPRFAFGTWKVEVLGGFAGAVLLVGVALLMIAGSIERLLAPRPIQYQAAMAVAALGLAVNVLCALLLDRARAEGHAEPQASAHGHGHGHAGHDDLNLRSAYLHVLADAATSLLAIVALAGGWLYGWSWLDPVMGMAGALLIGFWAKGLLLDTGKVLLDREMDHPVVAEIRAAVETGPEAGDTRIADLHVWRVGPRAYSCALTVVTHDATLTPNDVRRQLAAHEEIVHSTVEVQLCAGPAAGGSERGTIEAET